MGEEVKCNHHSGLDAEIASLRNDIERVEANNKRSHDMIWTAINDLRSRLPHWAVAIISLLTGCIGWLLS